MCKFTTFFLLCSTLFLFSTSTRAQNTDIELLKDINGSSSTGMRNYSKFISKTTTTVAVSTPLVMLAVGIIEKNDELLKNALYVGASIGIDGALTYSMKHIIRRPRPYLSYPSEITPFETLSSHSFPSGHTSLAFTTATALSLKYPKWYIIGPSYFWACSVGYSRMNLGVHYPSDVLAGAVLGAGSAYLTYKLNNWFWKKYPKKIIKTSDYGL